MEDGRLNGGGNHFEEARLAFAVAEARFIMWVYLGFI